ncbi:MAG TPA: aldolase/citrate lyase family protein, partial [Caulobacteraceae bacterium]|nr:aldolase/citrate lyase family protein [Caulobacteraceae bacterium]
GAFIKTPHHQVAEVMGHAGLDFAVIDAEHAPFGPADIDRVVLGAASAGLPCLVRSPDHGAGFINQCLDLGASGILAPHVTDASAALALAGAVKFAGGERGFSPSTRAGGYGGRPDYRAGADAASTLWCQIEDAAALTRLDEIVATPGVDCLFLGRVDLALSLGVERSDDPKMVEAIGAVALAARRAGRALGVYVGDPGEIAAFRELGASVIICGSDQSWLKAQGRAARAALAG